MNFDEYLAKNKHDSAKLKRLILNGQLKTKPKEWSDIQIQDIEKDVLGLDANGKEIRPFSPSTPPVSPGPMPDAHCQRSG